MCYSPWKRLEMTKSTSFDDVPISMYPGSWAAEIVSRAKKTMCYSPQKRPEMTKTTSFDDVSIFVYPGTQVVEIVSGAKNRVLYPTKTARNDQIDEFWRCLNFHVTGVTSRWNHLGSRKLCAIAKPARNDQIDEFLRRLNFHVPGITSR